jgi:carbamoyl-phosphate synthase large subunit
MGIDHKYEKALYKALLAAGMNMSAHGTSWPLCRPDKEEGIKLVKRFSDLVFGSSPPKVRQDRPGGRH